MTLIEALEKYPKVRRALWVKNGYETTYLDRETLHRVVSPGIAVDDDVVLRAVLISSAIATDWEEYVSADDWKARALVAEAKLATQRKRQHRFRALDGSGDSGGWGTSLNPNDVFGWHDISNLCMDVRYSYDEHSEFREVSV